MVKEIKWWALIPSANDGDGGDGKEVRDQVWFYWPSNVIPEA